MKIPAKDRTILRRLAERWAKAAELPVQKTTADQWRRLNRLGRGKPMVWMNEICWKEIDEAQARETTDPFCRSVEGVMRRNLYQWDHLRVDMVVEPWFPCDIVVGGSGFGIQPKERTIDHGQIRSHGYEPVIKEEADVQKIKDPVVVPDWEKTEENFQALQKAFGDILPVRKQGTVSTWFAPWDLLVTWWGVEAALTDLAMRPELVHMAMERLTTALCSQLEQREKLGLLSLNNGNFRVGSGGLGYTDLLPQKDFDGAHVRPMDMWGSATAQIFSEVSPAMHEEFALKHELRWLERFGLNCYGCCEPLHRKIDMLKKIPRLRRISMSPRADIDVGAAAIGTQYIYSHKPNPAILATDKWNPAAARRELKDALDRTRGCIVEVILKDISTIRNEPRRLAEWAQIATEVTAEYA